MVKKKVFNLPIQVLSQCKEQWEEIPFDFNNLQVNGNAKINSVGKVITFPKDATTAVGSSTDFVGAVWNKLNIPHKSGISISFIPQITADLNCYANLCYPEGFAFVFTSTPFDLTLGASRSGLGYEGISNAVAFEFDFVQSINRNDLKIPHFSVHSNINGQISATSPQNCVICNKPLPNIYDQEKNAYIKEDLVFTIQVYGGTVNAFYGPESDILLGSTQFTDLDSLMNSNQIYFGITASMNLYKSLNIKNLKLSQIVETSNQVSIYNAKQLYSAGSHLSYLVKVLSNCQKSLYVYPSSYKKLVVKLDDNDFTNNTLINYDQSNSGLNVTIRELKISGSHKFDILWNKQLIDTRNILFSPSTLYKFDVCEPAYNPVTGELSNSGYTTQDYYLIKICITDEFRNRKGFDYQNKDEIVYVEYPNLIPPTDREVEIIPNSDKSEYSVKIPLIATGKYTLFNRLFFNSQYRYFTITSNGVSSAFSSGEIDDLTSATLNNYVFIILNLKDPFSNILDSTLLTSMNCSPSESTVLIDSTKEEVKFTSSFIYQDGKVMIKYTPTTSGLFTFKPRVKCGDTTPVDIKCEFCYFSIANDEFNDKVFKFFSDYLNTYLDNLSITNINPIYVSLDEDNNKKITEMVFIDKGGNKILPSSDPTKFNRLMTDLTVRVIKYKSDNTIETTYSLTAKLNLASAIEFYISSTESKKRSELFNPLGTYKLEITIPQNTGLPKLSLDIAFIYADDFLNNVSTTNTASVYYNYLAFWIPETKVIKATSNSNLFRILARNSAGNVVMGSDMNTNILQVFFYDAADPTKVIKEFTSVKKKFGIFIYVYSKITIAGNYRVKVWYNAETNVIADIPFQVEPRNEVYSLETDANNSLIVTNVPTTETLQTITLKDQSYGSRFSLVFKMKDLFGNTIQNNFYSVYNSISITNNSKARFSENVDGTFTLYSQGEDCGSYSVSFSLPTGKQYVINWKVNANFTTVSVNDFEVDVIGTPSIDAGNYVQANVNYKLISILKEEDKAALEKVLKERVVLYAFSKNGIYPFNFTKRDVNQIIFTSNDRLNITNNYEIKAFKDDLPLRCGFCNFAINPLTTIDRFQPYLIDNGEFLPLLENYSQIISLPNSTQRLPTFFLKKLDKYGNEIFSASTSLSADIKPLGSNETKISLCSVPTPSSYKVTRDYLEICAGDIDKVNALNGNFLFTDPLSKRYNLLITSSPLGSSETPDKLTSFLQNVIQNVVTATVDTEAIVVVDLRDNNGKRSSSYLSDKIKVTGLTDIDVKVFRNTPSIGLFSLIFSTQKIIKPSDNVKFTITYNNISIIENITFVNNPGTLAKVSYTQKQYIFENKYYFQFKLEDQAKSVPSLFNKNVYEPRFFLSFLNVINDKDLNIRYDYSLNDITGVYNVIVEAGSYLSSTLKFRYGLNGSNTESVNILIGQADPSKSYASVTESVSTPYAGDSAVINFSLLDSNGISIDLTQKSSDLNVYLNVMVRDTLYSTYKYLETKSYVYGKAAINPFFNYNFPIPGDYIFIPKLGNNEISCVRCRIFVNQKANDVDLSKSQLFIKVSNIGWENIYTSESYSIFQSAFPFFRLIVNDSFGTMVRLDSLDKYTFTLSSTDGKKTLNIEKYQTKSNGILIYLSATERTKWLTLDSLTQLKLTVVDNGNSNNKIQFTKLFVFNAGNMSSQQNTCKDPLIAKPEGYQSKDIFIRSGNDALVLFSLQNCNIRANDFVDPTTISLVMTDPNIQSNYEVVIFPAEKYGTYLAVISSRTSRVATANIVYNRIKSSDELTIRVVYNLKPASYKIITADSYSANDDYGTFSVVVTDLNGNPFNREQSLFFYNDIYLTISFNKSPINYKITYSNSQNSFLVQFPIQGRGEYTIEYPYSNEKKVLTVNGGTNLMNSYFNYTSTTSSYILNIYQFDAKYNSISMNIDLSQWKIYYFSIDYITRSFNRSIFDSSVLKLDNNKIEINKSLLSKGHVGYFAIKTVVGNELIISTGPLVNEVNTNIYSFTSNGQLFNFLERGSHMFLDSSSALPILRSNVLNNTVQIVYKKDRVDGESAITLPPTTVGLSTYFSGENKCVDCSNLIMLLKLNDNSTTIYQQLQVTYVSNQTAPGTVDSSKVQIIGAFSRLVFPAGESGLLFIQIRDVKGVPVVTSPPITLKSDIKDTKMYIINSYFNGVYLVEVTNINNLALSDTATFVINNNESNLSFSITTLPYFPNSVDIQGSETRKGTTVRYTINGRDKFKNQVCDKRLNIKIYNQNLLSWRIHEDHNNLACQIEVNFLGSATIENIYKEKRSVINIEDIPSIDYFNSYVITTENYLSSGLGAKAKLLLILLSPLGTLYDSSLSTKIELRIYRLIDLNIRVLEQTVNCPFSCEFSPQKYGDYVYSTVVNGVELSSLSSLKYSHSIKPTPNSFKVFKRVDYWAEVTNLRDVTPDLKFDSFTETIDYPFNYRVSLTNEDNEVIPLPENVTISLNIKPYSSKGISENVTLSLESMQISETRVLITLPKDRSSSFLHIPQGNYVLVFTVVGNNFTYQKALPFVISGSKSFQYPKLTYSNEGDSLPVEIDIMGFGTSVSRISTNLNYYTTDPICIVNNLVDKVVYNNYLDPNLVEVSNSTIQGSCDLSYSIRYRGCFDLSIKCKSYPAGDSSSQYTLGLIYNKKPLKTSLLIDLDPQFPPKLSTIVAPFPKLVNQNSQARTDFSLSDEQNKLFQFVAQEDLRIFLNSAMLPSDKWVFSTNKGVSSITITPVYPPRNQVMKVYYDAGNKLVLLSNLTQTISLAQGVLNYKKAKLSIQAGIKAGDVFRFKLILLDIYNNCYEDNIDPKLIQISLSFGQTTITDFNITQLPATYSNCRSYLQVSSNTPNVFTNTGLYKLSLVYNKDTSNLIEKTFFVIPGDISPTKSEITVDGNMVNSLSVKAGDLITINFLGKDANSNSIPSEELIERFNISISNLVLGTQYTVSYLPTNTGIKINLQINVLGSFVISYNINRVELPIVSGLSKLLVTYGACSNKYPYLKPDKTLWYSGEYVTFRIMCSDDFNNTVSVKGNEKFTFEIKGKDLAQIGSDNLKGVSVFNNGVYIVKFLVIFAGQYDTTVFLNGKLYGLPISVKVMSNACPADNPIMCSNKLCVNSTLLCKEDTDFSCPQNKPFSCPINGVKTCVNSLVDCDCPSGLVKCRDACILESQKKSYCYDTSGLADCNTVVTGKSLIKCPDGTCRVSNNTLDCGSSYVCPLGYKKCGINCIRKTEVCNVALPTCPENNIVCWDFSCASSILGCPTRKSCVFNGKGGFICPDGRCVENEFSCIQPPTCYDPTPYLCADFTCAKSAANCPIKISCKPGESLCLNNVCSNSCSDNNIQECPSNQVACPTGECVSNILLCPTPTSCPIGYVKCNNGVCSKSFNFCPFTQKTPGLSCPNVAPILCPDLSCVTDVVNCKNITSCPAFAPFKCWNNECRAKPDQCPTQTQCPPSAPVQCSDGSCKTAAYHCEVDNTVCDNGLLRCGDGSCVVSMSLCPSSTTCPIDLVKCWDGSCVENINKCISPSFTPCPASSPIMCSDGTCRINKKSCSTVSVCPFNAPVKCYDGTCRETILLCPSYTPCGEGMISCPDGTCSTTTCSTIVTCPPTSPFKCYDNSCKVDIRDCPKSPQCSNFLCPDGSCVNNRMNCKSFDSCPPSYPVRCQQGTCAASVDTCNSIVQECPVGYFKCLSGGCKVNAALCEKLECPVNFPYLCKEGICVSNPKECDLDNGCPYNLPFKCADGTCVEERNSCLTINSGFICPVGQIGCPDGSCQMTSSNCPLQNGCTSDKPQKCADGSCIDPTYTSCPILKCPFDKPIQCPSGECVSTTRYCPNILTEQEYLDCGSVFPNRNVTLFMCANGRCVSSPDNCRPVFNCPNGNSRCSDNSCRLSKTLCPKGNNCPSTRSYLCPSGKCVKNEEECNSICPLNHTFCLNTGQCVPKEDTVSCPASTTLMIINGCPNNLVKCPDGRCMETQEDCYSVNIACSKALPYLCPDGSCHVNPQNCSATTSCPSGFTKCPDKTCVLENEYWTKCKNQDGCPFTSQLRCTDGSCSSTQCPVSISCPISAPFRCADLSCVANPSFCNILYPCPASLPIRCSNGICVNNKDDCLNRYGKLCPISNPILCTNGNCVDNIIKCRNTFQKICSEFEYFCTNLGSCVKSYAECVGLVNASGKVSKLRARLLPSLGVEASANNSGLLNKTSRLQTTSCDYLCYDGSCVNRKEDCPLIPACFILEYRCPSGLCESSKELCANPAITVDTTSSNLVKCVDGIYRKECPDYNGCSQELPFQCPNGNCVKDKIDCIGYSMCPDINRPYRCFDGQCASDPMAECDDIYRVYSSESITQTISQYAGAKLDFVYDYYRQVIGSLSIPANALLMNQSYAEMKITPVPGSLLKSLKFTFNDTTIFKVSNTLLQSDGILDLETSILSPILNITISNLTDQTFRIPGSVFLAHNKISFNSMFSFKDFCFSRLSDNFSWQCLQRKKNADQTVFSFNSTGIYAILLYPLSPDSDANVSDTQSNILLNNIWLILIILGIAFVVSTIIFYIFSRVMRYKEKYKENKEKIFNMQNQIEDFKNMSTDCPGQTLGDNIAGIIYSRNPCHSIVSVGTSTIQTMENKIEDLQRRCKNVEQSNKHYEEKIQELNDQYKQVKFNIDMLKN